MARVDEFAAIQNALIDKGRNGIFYRASFDSNHKLSRIPVTPPTNPVTYQTCSPASVVANEVAATFAQAATRRRDVDDYSTWTWHLHLKFNEFAILHEFHYTLCENFVLIPSNSTTGVRQATARLAAAPQILHPTNQQSPSGTSVIYTLNVKLRSL